MRVAIFADSLPPSTDGVAHSYARLAETLDSRGIRYRFFSPFSPGKDISFHKRVRPMPYVPFPPYPHYRIATPGQKRLFKSLDRFKPDIIHVSSPTLVAYQALQYARQKGLPAVAAYHTDFVAYFKYYNLQFASNLGWSYLRWFYNQFSLVCAPSPATQQLLQKHDFKNVGLWQRGVNTSLFNPSRRKHAPGTKPRLLFVGRLVKEKDLDDLAEAYRILNKQDKKYDISFVGDGAYKSFLQKHLPGAAFHGFLHNIDLATVYANADIFVFPSTTETFGNVILEALASGLPVVTVAKGAVQNLVQNGKTGYVVEPHSPMALAEAVRKIVADADRKNDMRKAARAHAESFSWHSVNDKLIAHYENLLSRQPKRRLLKHQNI